MKNERRKVHENYHASTHMSSKIIKENNFTYRLQMEVINKYFSKNKLEILDIGCGAGTLSFYLASKGNRVTGIDISEKAIKGCVKSAKNLGLKNTEFFQSEFPEKLNLKKKFDGIIFTEVIEHLENDDLALQNIHSLLKPKGILILSTPSVTAPLHRLGLTKKFDEEVGHIRRYKLRDLKKMLKSKNFRIIETRKTEGILRNFLFVNSYAGKLVRYINFFGGDLATYLDNFSLKLFGESNYIIAARKVYDKSSKIRL